MDEQLHDGLRVRLLLSWPGYWIREDGAVLSVKELRYGPNVPLGRARILATYQRGSNGKKGGYVPYKIVELWENGKVKKVSVHSLVAEAFIGPRPDGEVVRHLDGDSQNNCAENLAYGSTHENALDQVRQGKKKPGPATKIHELERKIRKLEEQLTERR